MTSGPLQDAIERAVKAALGSVPLQSIDVVPGHDHDDDEALFVTVNLPPGSPLVGGERYGAAMVAVSDVLLAAGDQRIPYVRLHHTGEPVPDEGRRFRG